MQDFWSYADRIITAIFAGIATVYLAKLNARTKGIQKQTDGLVEQIKQAAVDKEQRRGELVARDLKEANDADPPPRMPMGSEDAAMKAYREKHGT